MAKPLGRIVLVWALLGTGPAAAQDIEWTRQFGTVFTDTAPTAAAVARSADGYVAGAWGGQHVYVRKYDPQGNAIWSRPFGTDGFDFVFGLAAEAAAVYAGGFTSGTFPGQARFGSADAFLRKLDSNGEEEWTRQFGTASADGIVSIGLHATGVYVLGFTQGTLPGQSSSGGRDAFVARFDRDGTLVWARQFGTDGQDVPGIQAGLAVSDDGVYLAGTVRGALPGQLAIGPVDSFLRKVDFHGDEVWTRQFGTVCGTVAVAVAVHDTGIYVTGTSYGDLDSPNEECNQAPQGQDQVGFVRRYDPDGNAIWTRQIRAGASDYLNAPEAVACDGTGVYVGGFDMGVFDGEQPGGPGSDHSVCPRSPAFEPADAYVRKYDFEGRVIWTRQFGTVRLDVVHGMAAAEHGVYAAGFTDCILPGQASAGGEDAFVVKLTATPSTAQGSVRLIVGQVETLADATTLNPGQAHALNVTLGHVIDRLDRGDVDGAADELQAFLDKVVEFRDAGVLSAAQAQALLDAAGAVLAEL